MKAFGERRIGVITSPSAVEQEILDKYGVQVIGRTDEITERGIKHPAFAAISEAVRSELFV